MGRFHGYLRLLRFERAISAMAGVVITGIVVKDLTGFNWGYVVACLVVFFSALANFALNDINDVEIDRLNQRLDRPIATGAVSRETAVLVVVFQRYLLLLCLSCWVHIQGSWSGSV